MLLVRRTCLSQLEPEDGQPNKPIPLEETQGFSAYALLGDPGSGKSKAFEQEAAAWGVAPISAGDFLGLDHPELRNASFPIFIDGLDETRAGMANGTVPLDGIRKKLQQLGCRRFRISCRAADWLGEPDARRLQSLLPEGETVQIFRLQPLTLADVLAILEGNYGIADPKAFVAAADLHGLTDLLFNPQTLEMLAKAVGSANHWPESRLKTYEMACARLAQEHNQEHAAATRKTAPNQATLRRAAGYLCVLHLLADLAGFSRSPDLQDRVLALNMLPNPESLPLDEAIASRLFKDAGRNIFAPVHRTVAEFLAASYLADDLNTGLSLRRFLALICGSDGGVVTGMRGLNAWLASLSPVARMTCSRLDPLGVVLYGDARNFAVPEKLTLIDALGSGIATSPLFRWRDWDGKPFSALVAREMMPDLAERLASENRSEENQTVLLALLEGLRLASPVPVLMPILLAMAREGSWWQSLRLRALKIYVSWVGVNDGSLRVLLDDVQAGAVEDESDEILGALLAAMYPESLSSWELPQFFHPPKKPNHIGKYSMFWRHDLKQVRVEELPILLDAFADRLELRRVEATRDYAKAVGGLLVRSLKEVADEVPDDRLLNWLNACCESHGNSLLVDDDKQFVRQWLEARPRRYFSLLDLALTRYWTDRNRAWSAEARLHGASSPSNGFTWWLAKAEATIDDTRAKEYFVRTVCAIPAEPGPALDDLLNECHRVANLRGWQETLSEGLSCDLEQHSWRLEEAARAKERQHEAMQAHAYFRKRLVEFSLPLAPLEILEPVSTVYEEKAFDIDGETPMTRLRNFFSDDEELVQAALQALRNAVMRDDLPSIEETLVAAEDGQIFNLNAAALTGLQLRYGEEPSFLRALTDERLTALVVAHLIHTYDDQATWVAAAVQSRPQHVADALMAYLTAAWRWKQRSPNGTYRFRNVEYREVADRCLLPLLANFPLRARPNIRGALADMLHAALNVSARDELAVIIKDRVETPRMDGPQRANWLAAGLLVAPDRYLPLAACCMQRRPLYVHHIAEFFHYRREAFDEAVLPSSKVLGVLIEHFAIGCQPARPTGAHWVSPEMNRAELVRGYINDLAGRSDAESAAQLRRLSNISALSHWATLLRDAYINQRIVRRDATFESPSWAQVCATLQRGLPTTPAEIAAVVNDTIQDLEELIRYSDLNLHDQYWNTDKHGKAEVPRHEEVCRNAFGDQLRVRLQRFGIGCLPETQHADGKRSDLWCTNGLMGVPIEVKKDHHLALWTATKGQLMARYATDPRAKGHGIYVVFWFGQPSRIPAPPFGDRPMTPQALKAMLESSLTDDEQRVITIHVIDCSARQEQPPSQMRSMQVLKQDV